MNGCERLLMVVLGDSIAWGEGAARPPERLAPRLLAGLAAAGVDAAVEMLAVPGALSADLRPQVDLAVAVRPDLAVIVIGANDVTNQVLPDRAAAHLGDAVRRLRDAGAEVVVAAAPDLSSVPRVPPFLRDAVRAASERMRERQEEVTRTHGGWVADPGDTGADAFARDAGLFSADLLHPSSAGYAVIAQLLLPAVLAAAGVVAGRTQDPPEEESAS